MRKHKVVQMATTPGGFQTKVFVNRRTGTVLPTNWKQQSMYLAGERVMTKRLANRARRRAAERATAFEAQYHAR